MKSRPILLSFIFLLLFSCDEKEKSEKKNEKSTPKVTKAISKTPLFNADSAYKFVADQVAFGPRVPNLKAHVECSKYLKAKMESFGLEVMVQEFEAIAYDGTKLNSFNIIGSFNPKASKRILLASHWDSRPFADRDKDSTKWNSPVDGANDGASGVGILLEIARVLDKATTSPEVGVDVIFFDAEDYGEPSFFKGETKAESWCLGSQHWSRNKHKPNYYAYYGILLDMVGAKNATFYKEGESMSFAPSVVHKVWQTAQGAGFGKYFVNDYTGSIIDDHAFVNRIAGIPMIDIIHYNHANDSQFFGDYWHTHNDNMNAIDKETLNAVGQTLLEVLYAE